VTACATRTRTGAAPSHQAVATAMPSRPSTTSTWAGHGSASAAVLTGSSSSSGVPIWPAHQATADSSAIAAGPITLRSARRVSCSSSIASGCGTCQYR
jgi:hypothetical protein